VECGTDAVVEGYGEGPCAASLVIYGRDARELPEADGRKFGLSVNCVCCERV
jgi:hypothetical protein